MGGLIALNSESKEPPTRARTAWVFFSRFLMNVLIHFCHSNGSIYFFYFFLHVVEKQKRVDNFFRKKRNE
jgi:hypothetical protein